MNMSTIINERSVIMHYIMISIALSHTVFVTICGSLADDGNQCAGSDT